MADKKVPLKIEPVDFTNILIAVFVLIITLGKWDTVACFLRLEFDHIPVIFALYRRKRTSRNCILLTGLCDSGKTLIFSQLVHKRFVQTHTSIKENIGSYILNNVRFFVVFERI